MKFFDKWQKIILIGLGVSGFLMVVFYVAMVMTAKVVEGTEEYLLPQYFLNMNITTLIKCSILLSSLCNSPLERGS